MDPLRTAVTAEIECEHAPQPQRQQADRDDGRGGGADTEQLVDQVRAIRS